MERILTISDQLQKLLDEAKKEAERIVADAQKRSDEKIAQAKAEAETELIRAQRFSKRTEKEKIKKEAAQILKEYQQKAASLKRISNERLLLAINLILTEVLPQ
jgi:vacuolar-type H+-ATPase subunit H